MSELNQDLLLVGSQLARLVVLAFLVERGLAVIFERDFYERWFGGRGVKPFIAFLVALVICFWYDFDVVAAVLEPEAVTGLGIVLTAGIVAGGSAAAVKLFQDVLGFSKQARDQLKALRAAEADAKRKQAEADAAEADAKSKQAQANAAEAEARMRAAG